VPWSDEVPNLHKTKVDHHLSSRRLDPPVWPSPRRHLPPPRPAATKQALGLESVRRRADGVSYVHPTPLPSYRL
jgi:hypothetical protein